jgi:sugar phosphate permease
MSNKKHFYFLIFACCFVWTIMMGSKNIYTAEYIEISRIFGVDKPQASLAMTFYFITYSTAQVLLFFCMDKINIKWFMLISVFLSGLVTVLIALATGLWQLWWILAINGILQAGIWGMCTALLNRYLPTNLKATANMLMNIGMALAGIISYGSASLFTSFRRIDSPFVFFGIILSISAVLLFISVQICEKKKGENACSLEEGVKVNQVSSLPFTLKTSKRKCLFYVLTFILSFAIHFVFYGTLNWIPNMLQENFAIPEQTAIIVSVLAPLATIFGAIIAIRHCEKYTNFVIVELVYLILATAFALSMIFIYNVNAILSLLVLIIYLIIIQGAVTIIFSVISYKLCDYINTGAHSGLMNAAGGFAAGFAPPIVGAIIETNNGWQLSYVFVFALTLIVVLSIVVILFAIKKSRKSN